MSIDITEAWLPPVANDAQAHMIDDPLDERNLLPLQFAADKGHQVVNEYFRSKRKDYSYLTRMQSQAEKAFEVEEIRGSSRREAQEGDIERVGRPIAVVRSRARSCQRNFRRSIADTR